MEQDLQTSPFDDLAGQPRAKSLLEKSLRSGRIAHAYLFRGPDGVGKKLFANAVAKALNCRTSGPGGACGRCSSCKKFDSGNHPDFNVESPDKGAIKIDRVRQLCKSLSYPPYESAYRVVVLEDIHCMRPEAANSLLKTLEEPPEGNVLILTAETSKMVLPTILSRCQIIPFFPLSDQETADILEKKHEIPPENAGLLARLAEGSPGRALVLHATDMMGVWQGLTAFLEDEEMKKEANCPVVLRWAQKLAELKENLVPFLGLLRLWLRDRLEGGKTRLDDESARRRREEVFAKLEAIDRAERELGRNCNRLLVCEILLFRLQ